LSRWLGRSWLAISRLISNVNDAVIFYPQLQPATRVFLWLQGFFWKEQSFSERQTSVKKEGPGSLWTTHMSTLLMKAGNMCAYAARISFISSHSQRYGIFPLSHAVLLLTAGNCTGRGLAPYPTNTFQQHSKLRLTIATWAFSSCLPTRSVWQSRQGCAFSLRAALVLRCVIQQGGRWV
jgi:hypothetical protein